MPTADTNNNFIIPIYDGIATVGSDYGTTGITSSIHLPFSKLVWGNDLVSRRVSTEYPMPVDIKTLNGITASTLPISGTVSGTGTFYVASVPGSTASTIYVVGPSNYASQYPVYITGMVQGITNGILTGVTGAINVNNTVAIQGISGGYLVGVTGTITATGGRRLNSTTDSVSGTFIMTGVSMASPVLSYVYDSVKIRGSSGEAYIPTILQYLVGNTLTAIGTSGDALKVSIVNTGVTFTVSIGAVVGVTNASEGPLKIQGGTASDNPVLIKYYNGTTVPVSTLSPISVDIVSEGATFGAHMSEILSALNGATGSITAIKANTSLISNINEKLTSSTMNVRVTEFAKPRLVVNGIVSFTNTTVKTVTTNSGITLRSGINIKAPNTNTSTVYLGSETLISSPANAYPLEAGESIFLECSTTDVLYCYTLIDPTKQKLLYIAS